MANKKISELAAATALTGAEQFPVVQGGATVRTTIGALNGTYGRVYPIDGYGGATTAFVDNAAAIQTCIDAAYAAGGGDVLVPAGTWYSGQIKMKTRVRLVGTGWGSCLKLKANTDFIVLDNPAASDQVEIRDLRIDGNKGAQTTGGDGIKFTTSTVTTGPFPSGFNNPRHRLIRVMVHNIHGNGFNLTGDANAGAVETTGCHAYHCDGAGFVTNAPDSVFTDCDSGQSGTYGFWDTSGQNRFIGCKGWNSGRLDATNGDGFRIIGRGTMAGCTAQDNARHGFLFQSAVNEIATGLVADSNGVTTAGDGVHLDTATACYIEVTAYDRQGVPTQQYGVNLSTSTKNIAIVTAGTLVHTAVPSVQLGSDNLILTTSGGAPSVLSLGDGATLTLGTTTGTKIGTATTEKLGFFNATPVVQPAGTVDVLASLVTLGLRAATSNPPLNLGSGALTAGAATLAAATVTTLGTAGDVTLADANNVAVGTSTGTKIGTATSQKLGFFNATPVVQQTGSSDVLASLVSLGLRAASSNPPLNLGSGAITAGAATLAATTVTTLGTGGLVTLADANDIAVGTTTGTKIGTGATQKLGFFGVTPVVQRPNSTDLKQVLIDLGLIASGGVTGLNLNGGNLFTSGNVTGTANVVTGSNSVAGTATINGPAASFRQMLFTTASVNRWILRANNTAEGGSNAGSDLELSARDDTGASLATSLIFRRSDSRATFAGEVVTPAATTTIAGLNVPHGAAPTSPVNGDIWTTTAGLFVRINGATVGPLT